MTFICVYLLIGAASVYWIAPDVNKVISEDRLDQFPFCDQPKLFVDAFIVLAWPVFVVAWIEGLVRNFWVEIEIEREDKEKK